MLFGWNLALISPSICDAYNKTIQMFEHHKSRILPVKEDEFKASTLEVKIHFSGSLNDAAFEDIITK